MKYFFQKPPPFSQGTSALDAPDSNTDGFFGEIHVFFNVEEQDYLEQTEPISTLKTMICRKYLFTNYLTSHR
jgi:hypothetical protein